MCMEDVRIARSQTVRSVVYTMESGVTSFVLRPWQRRSRLILTGVNEYDGTTTPPQLLTPAVQIDELDPLGNFVRTVVVQNLITPLDFGIERFGQLVQGGLNVTFTLAGLDPNCCCIELEYTLPDEPSRPFGIAG